MEMLRRNNFVGRLVEDDIKQENLIKRFIRFSFLKSSKRAFMIYCAAIKEKPIGDPWNVCNPNKHWELNR